MKKLFPDWLMGAVVGVLMHYVFALGMWGIIKGLGLEPTTPATTDPTLRPLYIYTILWPDGHLIYDSIFVDPFVRTGWAPWPRGFLYEYKYVVSSSIWALVGAVLFKVWGVRRGGKALLALEASVIVLSWFIMLLVHYFFRIE